MALQDLISQSLQARQRAYVPHSHFCVGAALLTDLGVYTGCNLETAMSAFKTCAERTAVAIAVSAGAREIRAVVVASGPGLSPCGMCRQVLREFAKEDCVVTCVNEAGEVVLQATMGELLPDSFNI